MDNTNPSPNHEQHVNKKQKTATTPSLDLAQATETAWEHFRNFLDSVAAQDEGDVDELVELLEILKPHLEDAASKTNNDNDVVSSMVQHYRSTQALLPVLCSVAQYHLADAAIVQTLDTEEENTAAFHLKACLDLFDKNAACWSVGANYGRMTQTISPSVVCVWYKHAAQCACQVRSAALRLLDGPDAVDDPQVKEWIELLFLDSIVDAEYVVVEGEEHDEQEEQEGYFSASRVEAISRFMVSMLSSTAGRHDEALEQLKKFDLTHRLHPNVWDGVVDTAHESTTATAKNDPMVYPKAALPPNLYQRLCEVFAPDATYWKESDYAHRGYFSFFFDIQKDQKPSNLIEDVIVGHLLPLAKNAMTRANKSSDDIVGAEWWVHTRPIQANLGHNLHFDTDEALLTQEGTITHPVVSSVLYLTGNTDDTGAATSPAGATIVLDQTPDSDKVAEFCWTSRPRDNSYMLFPGNLLHGVLPCPGNKRDSSEGDNDNKSISLEFRQDTVSTDPPKQHRLTFMVGFWTRSVPEKMKERRLYGPCGPMPPPTKDHSWAIDIAKEYDESMVKPEGDTNHQQEGPTPLPRVYPAWEEIKHETVSSDNDTLLELPSVAQRIDHRFFVKDAPECFRNSLFEGDSDDE